MKAITWANISSFIIAIILALIFGLSYHNGNQNIGAHPEIKHSDKATTIADATGHIVKIRNFQRIVSQSPIADRLLFELCEPNRIITFSPYGAQQSPWGYQYVGKNISANIAEPETIFTLVPDLVLVNSSGSSNARSVARLREAGIEVFDLGEMHGVESLIQQAHQIAKLIGHNDRGLRFTKSFLRRLRSIAATLDITSRKRAIYLATMGSTLFGGTIGTSYHDILTYAGLIDVAALNNYQAWPHYRTEDILTLAPEIIVTKNGMKQFICQHSGLKNLSACTKDGQIIELPSQLIDNAGPAMLDAAELLFAAVYE
ncbi:MAG: ABC transporter substrate-binding protein [Deltaproteobacteria bacterium]|nr:ABC transporter substrate-binding protein [Deltaproteobacteria bacterium]